MRKVIGIGETVLDIIFRNDQPTAAVPGGSTFNAMISLGRCGVPTDFISETGNDRIGKRIIDFLQENGVNTEHVNVFPDSKSPLSLAFLNDSNDAEYIFYKDHPRDQLDFVYPEINADDIVLFGSYYALNPVIRPQVKGFLDYARSRGAIIYYDVNFRPSHQDEVMKLTPNLLENFGMADIVRGSHEDFDVLFKRKMLMLSIARRFPSIAKTLSTPKGLCPLKCAMLHLQNDTPSTAAQLLSAPSGLATTSMLDSSSD